MISLIAVFLFDEFLTFSRGVNIKIHILENYRGFFEVVKSWIALDQTPGLTFTNRVTLQK